MIRPSRPAAPIRNGSRFFRRKPYVRRAPTRKNADSSLRFGPAPNLRRFSRGIRRKLGHPRNLRPPAFRHIRQPIAYLIVPVFEFHMFPVSSYETAPDGRDFIGSGPTGYATCGRKPQPADTEIPDANMLGARKLHNRHPTIGEKTSVPAIPRSLLPSIPKADVSSCRPFPGSSATRVPKRALLQPSRIFRRLRGFYCWSNFFTASEIARPSARPANCFVATPITLPMSDGAWAPTCSIMAFRALSSSASLI